jgi:hypothetical protein
MFEVSEQERELIEILREWASSGDEYNLEVRHSLGAYEIKLSMVDQRKWARGVGSTFDSAWEAMRRGDRN